jgi:hypothetical protein
MASTFYAQIYFANEYGKLSLTDPKEIMAASHDEAAKIACGKGVTPVGPKKGKLAAKIWRIGLNSRPAIKLYYRS